MSLPCGTFARSYKHDKAIVRTRLQWALLIAFLVLLVILPLMLDVGFLGMINVTAITLLAVVGLQITQGYAGQVNLGQSAFMGVGAYVAAVIAANWGWPFWLTIPAGGAGAALFGALFAIPALRLKGFYLALTTFAAQVVFPWAVMHLPQDWAGGSAGIRVKAATLGSIVFDSDLELYYLITAVTVLMVYFAYGVVRSRTGRAFVAVRDNESAAGIMGINVFAYKTIAFFVGALFAGVAGVLWAYYVRFVGVDQFTMWFSIWYVGMIIVGGEGSLLGAIMGTVLLRALQEVMTYLGPWLTELFPQVGGGGAIWFAGMNIILGGVIIAFVIRQPKGLVHRWAVFKASYRLWPFPY